MKNEFKEILQTQHTAPTPIDAFAHPYDAPIHCDARPLADFLPTTPDQSTPPAAEDRVYSGVFCVMAAGFAGWLLLHIEDLVPLLGGAYALYTVATLAALAVAG